MSERQQAKAAQTKNGKKNPPNSERPTVEEVLRGDPGTQSFYVADGKVHRREEPKAEPGPNDATGAFKGEQVGRGVEDPSI